MHFTIMDQTIKSNLKTLLMSYIIKILDLTAKYKKKFIFHRLPNLLKGIEQPFILQLT